MNPPRTVIFLDIDGVLQPHSSQQRFRNDLVALRERLAAHHDNAEYLTMDRHDLGAVYYDWDQQAIDRLRKLCVEIPAEIVISSDWRTYSPLSRLKDYFRIHDLDQHITGELAETRGKTRCDEVTVYLRNHPEIQRFVILDDAHVRDFETHYPEHFVYCPGIFDDACYERAKGILKADGITAPNGSTM